MKRESDDFDLGPARISLLSKGIRREAHVGGSEGRDRLWVKAGSL